MWESGRVQTDTSEGIQLGEKTHRSPAGIPDIAIGDGLVYGEAKVSPAHMAYYLAIPPDGLQAEHGHFSAGTGAQTQGAVSPGRDNVSLNPPIYTPKPQLSL